MCSSHTPPQLRVEYKPPDNSRGVITDEQMLEQERLRGEAEDAARAAMAAKRRAGAEACKRVVDVQLKEKAAAKGDEALADFAGKLEKVLGELQAATMWFMGQGMQNPNQVGAGAHPYMHLMGVVALGLMWLRMAKAANEALASGAEDKAFLEAKLVTARYFADRVMPEAGALRRKIEGGSEAMMALPPEMFVAA